MAIPIQISPPGQFSFKSDDWEQWSKRFERFRSACGLKDKSQSVQIDTLIYCMGEQAEEIFNSFVFTPSGEGADATLRYACVKGKFQDHFIARRNIIYERAKFNKCKQNDSETVDQFITRLYNLAEHCDYGTLKEELIRDRIVVGIRDLKLQQKLQLNSELTLEKAKTTVRLNERVQK